MKDKLDGKWWDDGELMTLVIPDDPMTLLIPDDPTYHLSGPDHEPILRTSGGRIWVRGEETSDVERIGAAFRDWAIAWAAQYSKEPR